VTVIGPFTVDPVPFVTVMAYVRWSPGLALAAVPYPRPFTETLFEMLTVVTLEVTVNVVVARLAVAPLPPEAVIVTTPGATLGTMKLPLKPPRPDAVIDP